MSVSHEKLTELTAMVLGRYLSNPNLDFDAVHTKKSAATIYDALSELNAPAGMKHKDPAVDPKKSVTDNYIVCLEDGKRLKMLKRHLRSAYDMTPEQYRKRWNLAKDYPMTAPNYAKQRSKLAKAIGLGTKK